MAEIYLPIYKKVRREVGHDEQKIPVLSEVDPNQATREIRDNIRGGTIKSILICLHCALAVWFEEQRATQILVNYTVERRAEKEF